MSSVNERLKDPAEREEEELDRHFARRYLVTDTNLPVVVSPKGGSGKTTVALILGDALASRMPNQRVAAIDFNPGGGALEAVATEDRAARFSMLQLHRDREQVRSHAQLQPYVASLHSGLDLLAVAARPGSGPDDQASSLRGAVRRGSDAELQPAGARHQPGYHLAGDAAGVCSAERR